MTVNKFAFRSFKSFKSGMETCKSHVDLSFECELYILQNTKVVHEHKSCSQKIMLKLYESLSFA